METATAAVAGATTDHQYRPSLRLCEVLRPAKGSCGFHLSRTQWDPYPWVSGVDAGSAAEAAGLLAGDCVLEVNGEDVLGERIGAVATRVRARPDKVSLLLWNAGSDPHIANSVCGSGPTPLSLQRLSSCLQAALQLLECPVCLEPASPRALQCANGHLLCSGCRARTERCPVCRVALGPRGRCLLADQLQALLANACQPAPRPTASAAAAASTAAAASASTAANASSHRRHDLVQPPTPAGGSATTLALPQHHKPLVQLKSRLILPPKSSSVEDICTRKQGSTQTEGDAQAPGQGQGQQGGQGGAGGRARSHSTGQIPDNPSAALKDDAEPLVQCPRGPQCSSTHPASRLMQHLREAHDGPLVQYFLGGSGALTVRAPAPGANETVALTGTNIANDATFFVCCAEAPASDTRDRRQVLVWLWALAAGSGVEGPGGPGCSVVVVVKANAASEGGGDTEATPVPVFPLATPWEEVVASDRCLRVTAPEDDAPVLLHLQMRVSTTDKLASPSPTPSMTPLRAVSAVSG